MQAIYTANLAGFTSTNGPTEAITTHSLAEVYSDKYVTMLHMLLVHMVHGRASVLTGYKVLETPQKSWLQQ